MDMEATVEGGKDSTEIAESKGEAMCVGTEVFHLRAEPLSKKRRVVEIYKKLKSVPATAVECSTTITETERILIAERDRKKLSDIRYLYAENESQFNIGVDKDVVVSQGALMRLVETQKFRCALSGVELTPENAALDHILPVAKGGEHKIENLQWVHKEVNRMKGAMDQDTFVEMCRLVVNTATPPGFEPSY